jgi:hypothetical protein
MTKLRKQAAIALLIATLGFTAAGCKSNTEKAAEKTADSIEGDAGVVRDMSENMADKVEDVGAASKAAKDKKADVIRSAAETKADVMDNTADAVRDGAKGK